MRSDQNPVGPTDRVDLVEDALAGASAGFIHYRRATPAFRARILRGIADHVEIAVPEIVAAAEKETGLGVGRLTGEARQAVANLRLYAEHLVTDPRHGVVVDRASESHPVGPHPTLVSTPVPVGVALNFAASNFPIAFSVAGVDTGSALAAGCPVVVKVHPGHPETSRLTFAAMRSGIVSAGGDPRIVQLIEGQDEGIRALRDPRVKVATFTGSLRGGRALAAIAAERPDPIPFYGELGSINPVVITPNAVAERSRELADGLVGVITDSGGQVCTKPGLVFVPRGSDFPATVAAAAAHVVAHRMLYPGLAAGYRQAKSRAEALSGAAVVFAGDESEADDGQTWVRPTVLRMSVDDALRQKDEVSSEVFGPFVVLVEYGDQDCLPDQVATLVDGSLTASVQSAGGDRELVRDLLANLQFVAGRIVVDDWPMAVHNVAAQHHGGPFPATTLDVPDATSVGMASLRRFVRTVTWEGVDSALMPPERTGTGGDA